MPSNRIILDTEFNEETIKLIEEMIIVRAGIPDKILWYGDTKSCYDLGNPPETLKDLIEK